MENLIPHINVPAEFNQDTLESTHERHHRLLRKRHARQRIKSSGPSEMPQERSNCLCQERQIVQQTVARAQPSLGNDALQLFGDKDASALAQWDYGEMDTIYGFCNAKMWIKERLVKSSNSNPKFFFVLREWQSSVIKFSCNTARVGSYFN